ncbi:MAG: hypothetical protein FWF56_03500 [Firmicutes bacterium]|nr:hypothetical protein [Bacillota bacterium]
MAQKEDGLVKGLFSWINNIEKNLQKNAQQVINKVIDERAKQAYQTLKANTPKGETGNLQASLKKEKLSVAVTGKYGYRIYYDGYTNKPTRNFPSGTPYAVIANSLNLGWDIGSRYSTSKKGVRRKLKGTAKSRVRGTFFIGKSIQVLKGWSADAQAQAQKVMIEVIDEK